MIFRSPDRPPEGISRREWRRRNVQATPSSTPPAATPVPAPVLPAPFPQPATMDADDTRPTILTVCTGNICRSPMAEILLRARLESLGVRVHSAGTHALVDHAMTEPAQELAIEHGAGTDAASAHRARYLVEPMLKDADLVLTMAREHRSHAVQLMPSALRRTFTLREFARLAQTLSTEDARAAADATGENPRDRLRAAALAVTAQRGVSAAVPDEDDVIDPYRRSRETYELSTSQLTPAIDDVERIVRAALA
ncbi:low molecular weight phosphatase family protein [Microbacterium aerolatum]|uniref:arsenate reductase/protein-tyrosine-phosphatase family protein n=1 Tax=Microbacterium aerolatum TaxID=153731 RepID=UPI00384F652A